MKGSLTLLSGDPGVGKSTLLMKVVGSLAENTGERILFVSGEESCEQVAIRARRMGISSKNILVLNETSLNEILVFINAEKINFIIIDSIQTITVDDMTSQAGGISQLKEITNELMLNVKRKGFTAIVVGHVSKSGGIAGPKVLEHMVDTVLYLEGEKCGVKRVLRSIKNRFGATDEFGLFEFTKNDLVERSDATLKYIEKVKTPASGSAIACIAEGTRSIIFEIQTLISDNHNSSNRKFVTGLDLNRFNQIVAVVEKSHKVTLITKDLYLNILGGLKIQSRVSDLAVVASLLSSALNRPYSKDFAFIGEVTLHGVVREAQLSFSFLESLKEAGIKTLIGNISTKCEDMPIKIIKLESILLLESHLI